MAYAASCNTTEYYNTSVTWANLTGVGLQTALRERVAEPHVVLPYTSSSSTDTWDALRILDADPDDSSRFVLTLYAQAPRRLNDTSSSGWNREHVWPKSYGVDYSGADYTDLHHLRASDWNVNSARGNKYFGNCDARNTGCSSPAHSEAANDTAANTVLFQPPASVRGDIARALFYMAVRYNGTDANTEDLSLSACPCQYTQAMGSPLPPFSHAMSCHS